MTPNQVDLDALEHYAHESKALGLTHCGHPDVLLDLIAENRRLRGFAQWVRDLGIADPMPAKDSLRTAIRLARAALGGDTMSTGQVTRLRAERDYLLARAEGANICRLDDPRRWTGTSSNALVRYVFGGDRPSEWEFPRDPSDLAACYRAVYRLPEHLRGPESRANELIVEYRHAVQRRYDLAQMDRMLAGEST